MQRRDLTTLICSLICLAGLPATSLAGQDTARDPAALANMESYADQGRRTEKTPAITTTVEADTSALLSGGLRLQSIRTEAERKGMQAGLAWRYAEIEKILKTDTLRLHQIFDFSRVMVNAYVLPPVIVVVRNMLRQNDDNTARLTRVGYRIEYPARVVTTPPQWTDFLLKSFPPPTPPSSVITPKNKEEANLWRTSVREGWAKGVDQANQIFEGSLALLTTTYNGMLEYHILRKEGVLTEPVTARTDLGVVINGREMNVGDTLFRLTRHSQFENPANWKPAPRVNSDSDFSEIKSDGN